MGLFRNVKNGIVVLVLLWSASALGVQEGQNFAPPNLELKDEFHVNLISGQVSPTLSTVAIGGAFGLSHSLSIHANDFNGDGYSDKFSGFIRSVDVGENILVDEFNQCQQFTVMRALSPLGSADFKVMRANNTTACYPGVDLGGSYSYQALGDIRHTLQVVENGEKLQWTTDDGTVILFKRAKNGTPGWEGGRIEKIIYPNGLTIYLDITRVTTNTGYQLEYIYSESAWARMPVYIAAINNAVEFCGGSACADSQHQWPKVEFIWPLGMPQVMSSGENIFTVIGPQGEKTQYKYAAHDLSLKEELGEHIFVGDPVNRKISPRLVGIKPAYSDEFIYRYQYKNNFMLESVGTTQGGGIRAEYNWWNLKDEAGIITRAFGPAGSATYTIADIHGQTFYSQSVRSGRESLSVNTAINRPGAPVYGTISDQGTFNYLTGYSALIDHFQPIGSGIQYHYEYSKLNLKKIWLINLKEPDKQIPLRDIGFPEEGSCNPKTCNKPLWISDAKGKRTHYTYHAQSGQVESVTHPADRNGINPQTRYTYEQKYAYFYRDGSSSLTRADTPIWVLTKEAFCRTSAATGNKPTDGCTKAGDEVIKVYDYGTEGEASNLQVKSITMTADGKSRRTCFGYDIYGNKISETSPKGVELNSGSCPN